MVDLVESSRLTPQQLEQIGKWLFGDKFKIALADFLNVDRRRINHWLDGDRPIPVGITEELLKLAKLRMQEIMKANDLLNKILETKL